MQRTYMSDVWRRLQTMTAGMEIKTPKEGSTSPSFTKLVDERDRLSLGLVDPLRVSEMHLSISLMSGAERAIDDVTVLFREPAKPESEDDVCCICLDNMGGEMCRRMVCLHKMHAGCAMTCLPTRPQCPVCRRDLSCPHGPPQPGTQAQTLPPLPPSPQRSPGSRRPGGPNRPPPMPGATSTSTATLPSLTPSAAASPATRRASDRAEAGAQARPAEAPHTPSLRGHCRSPVPRVVKALRDGLRTIRPRSWSAPRARVLPQDL